MSVDFTMMYVAHRAFSRDLGLLSAAGAVRPWHRGERARWELFTTQLHIHHRAEDAVLWPALRACDLGPHEVQTLDEMEMEHAQLDPLLERVELAHADGDAAGRDRAVRLLDRGLAAHMSHEEEVALPMVERHLGAAGWARFTGYFRETQGIRGAATYFPWLLEGAPTETRTTVLAVLPPPARLLFRWRWEPAFRRAQA